MRFLIRLFFISHLFILSSYTQLPAQKISFWDTQQKGTNYFNANPTSEWFESAAKANIKLVRFTYAKWKGEKRDFLLGNADDFQGIVESDFQLLLKYLNIADSLGIKVVITPISLPGARWKQNNNNVQDGRLWKEEKYQQQSIRFWKELAAKLKGHPAVVGYNIKNEPHPEIFLKQETFGKDGIMDWYNSIKNTPGDLNLFYRRIIRAIREIDTETPIIVESGQYATTWTFEYLEKLEDPNIIYSFHMYEPYRFTTQRINNGRFAYGDVLPASENWGESIQINKTTLQEIIKPVIDWAQKNNVPPNRIWAGEFGCSRKVEGVENYLADLISIFNENNWHWAFYSYREDVWDNMDYELGTENVPPNYWKYAENKTLNVHYNEIYGSVFNNPIWPVFEKEFKKKR